jgi:N-acetylglucosamine kinase-like BadF-type ATPase
VSRELLYGAPRGQIGQLAMAVAATAETDSLARAILQRAGNELSRLGNAMAARFGTRPIGLAGRVPDLHPLIEQSMRDCLAPGCDLCLVHLQSHIAAARMALLKVLT